MEPRGYAPSRQPVDRRRPDLPTSSGARHRRVAASLVLASGVPRLDGSGHQGAHAVLIPRGAVAKTPSIKASRSAVGLSSTSRRTSASSRWTSGYRPSSYAASAAASNRSCRVRRSVDNAAARSSQRWAAATAPRADDDALRLPARPPPARQVPRPPTTGARRTCRVDGSQRRRPGLMRRSEQIRVAVWGSPNEPGDAETSPCRRAR